MAGIRLRHTSVRNARMAITHPTKRYKTPILCAACNGAVHERKTIHLDFDSEGTTIVAPPVFELLRQAGLAQFGLTLENEVEKPPAQFVQLAGAPVAFTEETHEYEGKHKRLHVLRNRLLEPRSK